MATEIERKFLVKNLDWLKEDTHNKYETLRQIYIFNSPYLTIRYRYSFESNIGKITIKGPKRGMSCKEFEFTVPSLVNDIFYDIIWELPSLFKIRYEVWYRFQKFEVDQYFEDNKGLVVAEIELPTEYIKVDLPDWISEEITNDKRYLNCNLVKNPYTKWKK